MMRILLLLALSGLAAFGQGPRIGVIEVFGLRKVPREKVLQALGVGEGDRLPKSKADTEERIVEIPGILQANLEAICCEDGKAILFVGVEEKGSTHFDLNSPPVLEMRMPEEVEKEWYGFIAAVAGAARNGRMEEDLTQGHSLMADPDCRAIQLRFVELADKHFDLLREMVKRDADEEHRGIAAYLLGYSANKKAAAAELQYAMRDADATVRNNAMRALGAIAVLSELHPEQGIKVSPVWFIEMLNSTHFQDRSKAATSLVAMTERREEGTLAQLKERAVPALIEMAQWKSLGHALPAFLLLGRIGGLSEEQIQQMWKDGDRAGIVGKVQPAPVKGAGKK